MEYLGGFTDMNANFIRERIAKLRTEKCISEYKMSLDLGHSKSYIQSISSGKALPSMSEFLYICNYLDVSPKEFFDEDLKHPVKSHELNELTKDMTSDDLELLSNLTKRIKDL